MIRETLQCTPDEARIKFFKELTTLCKERGYSDEITISTKGVDCDGEPYSEAQLKSLAVFSAEREKLNLFEKELEKLLHKHGIDTLCDMADFNLAFYVKSCINNLRFTSNQETRHDNT